MTSFFSTRTRPQAAALAIGLLALAGQLSALYDPTPDPPGLDLGVIPPDKIAHVLIFGLPVFLLFLAGVRSWIMPALFALHAPVSEIIQSVFLPRDGSWGDLVADLLGIALGWAAGRRVLRTTSAFGDPQPEDRSQRDRADPGL